MEFVRASIEDAEELLEMQKIAFKPLLDKYKDFATNPYMESLEKVKGKLNQNDTYFYYIIVEHIKVGAIRVVDYKDGRPKRISPLFILPEHQKKGYAQKAMTMVEDIHGNTNWQLSTIKEEDGNCHLYEKMGYKRTEEETIVNGNMTIIYFGK